MTRNWHSVWVEVPHQLVPPVGRVGPDHHRSRQGGRLEPVDELGHVVEHDGDVEGAVVAVGPQPGRPRRRRGDHLGVAESEVVRHQAETIDVGQGEDGAADGFGCGAGVGASGCRLRLSRGHYISECL